MKKWLIIFCIWLGLKVGRGKGCRNAINEYYAHLPYVAFVEDSE